MGNWVASHRRLVEGRVVRRAWVVGGPPGPGGPAPGDAEGGKGGKGRPRPPGAIKRGVGEVSLW